MSNHVDAELRGTTDDAGRAGAESVAVEMYEADGAVVLFDAENPLAWVEAGSTMTLRECA